MLSDELHLPERLGSITTAATMTANSNPKTGIIPQTVLPLRGSNGVAKEAAMKSLWTRSRHACALKPCKLQYLVRGTLKFSRRNGRFFHLHQKNTMVLAHFSSQRLPWPPPSGCSQMAPKWLPDWFQMAPRLLPDCSQMAPRLLPDCSLLLNDLHDPPGMISPGDDTTLRCLRYDPKVPKVRP